MKTFKNANFYLGLLYAYSGMLISIFKVENSEKVSDFIWIAPVLCLAILITYWREPYPLSHGSVFSNIAHDFNPVMDRLRIMHPKIALISVAIVLCLISAVMAAFMFLT